MSIVELPYNFSPREYQYHLLKAFLVDKKRHFCCLWHRRAGKTKVSLNILMAASQQRAGAYYYLFPQLKQARRSVWEARGADGIRFIDHFAPSLIHKINNTEMLIEFKNGSIFRLLGSDAYDRLMGTNPLGVIYDEYSLQNPYAREYLVPILAENGGFEIFIYTPRGGNHGYKLYEEAKDNKYWFTQTLDITQTQREDGSPVITQEVVEEFRKSGWSEDKIEQEFYLSFTAAVTGAYFAKQLSKAEKDGRIACFPIDTSLPVYTFWDLGYRDSTAIWFAQIKNEIIYVINYYENRGAILSHYINYIKDWRDQNQIMYGEHIAPHDSAKTNFTDGLTVLDEARKMGLNFMPLPRINNKSRHIELGRSLFSKLVFHRDNCKRGLDCLREYHAKYNEAMGVFSIDPEHNWASHGADAYLYLAQYVTDFHRTHKNTVLKNAVNRSSIF